MLALQPLSKCMPTPEGDRTIVDALQSLCRTLSALLESSPLASPEDVLSASEPALCNELVTKGVSLS